MKPKVSVIVPIYNTEKYLSKCVDSIVNQTIKEIEIILVDDGSTDKCSEILEEYSKMDNRIIVITKENGGQGSARNMGLDIAKGEYIGFVDSDDWVEAGMYENMVKEIEEKKADVCICGRKIYSEKNIITNKVDLLKKEILINNKGRDYILKGDFFNNTLVVTNKVYRKNIIDKSKIRFYNVSHVGSEDTVFNFEVLLNIDKIVTLDKNYYDSLYRDGSTMRTYRKAYMKRTANLAKVIKEYCGEENIELYEDTIPVIILYFIQRNISLIKIYSDNKLYDIAEELKEACGEKNFREALKLLGFNKRGFNNLTLRGYRITGKIYVGFFSMLMSLRQYKLAARFIK